ncbi:MAG: sigma-70 family RNA polymerase sigma factor [Puia sp.]|nr:sigma-70 family RNA polymerase sigma factor [Puia sp.]
MSENRPYKEDDLLLLISGGDEQAFCRFYHQANSGIYNAVMTYVKDEHAAREIVQIVFIRIWDQRRLLRDVRSLKDYLFILARNTVFDHFRKITLETSRLAYLREDVPALHNNVLVSMQERECGQLLRQVISRLPSQQRQAYLMASEQEMSYEEIADRMQVSRLTVKRHLELARRFVRKYLHHHLHQQVIFPLFFFFSAAQIAGDIFSVFPGC